MDTVTGAVISDRVVLGVFLAVAVILIEALVLYKLGWAADLTASATDIDSASAPVLTPRKQFVQCLRDSVIANSASAAVGWLLAQYVIYSYFWSISFWITQVIISIAVELFILWVLRRKPINKSATASLAMNAASYALLVILFGLIYELGLASRI